MLSVTTVTSLNTIKNCFKLKEKEKEDARNKSQDEKSSVVSVAGEASTWHEIFSVIIFDAHSRDKWDLDSGCSHHMRLVYDLSVNWLWKCLNEK